MAHGIAGRSIASSQACKAEKDTKPLPHGDRLEMLAAASQWIGDCPAWIIMELETREKAEREMALGERRKQ